MHKVGARKLTVIVPFLNEGIEVAKTVDSVCQYAQNQVDILVINDASNYLHDYEEMLKPYPITYISFRDNDFLSPKWIFKDDPEPIKEIIDIPCVFGAAYAAS